MLSPWQTRQRNCRCKLRARVFHCRIGKSFTDRDARRPHARQRRRGREKQSSKRGESSFRGQRDRRGGRLGSGSLHPHAAPKAQHAAQAIISPPSQINGASGKT